jgi:hypothetical protein
MMLIFPTVDGFYTDTGNIAVSVPHIVSLSESEMFDQTSSKPEPKPVTGLVDSNGNRYTIKLEFSEVVALIEKLLYDDADE